jgi:hypothetical protein
MGTANLKPFKKGQTGNPKGRPPKLLSAMVRELKEQGYERVGPSTMLHTIETMIGLPTSKLEAMSSDADAPIAQRIIATHLLSKTDRLRLFMELLDRAHGKAKQSVDLNESGNVTHTITFKRG